MEAPAGGSGGGAAAAADDGSAGERVELTRFTCREALTYFPIPPPPSYGHRAELWNPEKHSGEVAVKLVQVQDDALIRLLSPDGALFAECPLPADGTTELTTAVEPVIDSSRCGLAAAWRGWRRCWR